MKKIMYLITLTAFLMISCQGNAQNDMPVENKDLDKPEATNTKVSYSIGYQLGEQMKKDSLNPDLDYIIQGFLDAYKGGDELLNSSEREKTMMDLQKIMMEKEEAKRKKIQEAIQYIENNWQEINPEYLKEHREKEGVKVTESGMQYKVLEPGSGKKGEWGELLRVHFIGKLANGTVIENTYNDYPNGLELPVDTTGLPNGWAEAFQMMPVGAKWELVLPPDLGYGAEGIPGNIPGHAVLHYEMEILENLGDTPPHSQPGPQDMQGQPPIRP